ncbi:MULTISPECIES: hypothetical protein [unclassified Pseudomonas]|jgi:hypothetical protein|uniref:hypothetical protein n=1 Tax=unclassified Pseudomonas TaxID=196821 RepID=UPI000EA9D7BA|nr:MULTISPECIES: hypothetical protein [unclassified Pseudomonas]AYF86340.1 hypothetical protein D6Z43_03840 [Pseudomonas sp. DY-1]MDH4653934.1 hypothetical protein [Pseudomonas sp. BN606]MRK22661.1 hypothetical protein [Pseudomonas sp. JG-B]
MKRLLQQRLQDQVDSVLPGFEVLCEFGLGQVIEIRLRRIKSHESIRITGVQLADLRGPGALDRTVEQLLFEIQAIVGNLPAQDPVRTG